MARLRAWPRSAQGLMILFVLVTVLPALALVFLGLRLMEQERTLTAQRHREALERLADQAARTLAQHLAAYRGHLVSGGWQSQPTPPGTVYVSLEKSRFDASPKARLPWWPTTDTTLQEPLDEPFATIDAIEFAQANLPQALEIVRTRKQNPATRAGALLREARILRKLNRANEALEVYRQLADTRGIGLAGTPIDLIALRTRCAIFAEQSRLSDLRQEAALIEAGLRQGRWLLDRPSYYHATAQLAQWLGKPPQADPQAQALASATEWLFQRWTAPTSSELQTSGAASQMFEGLPVLLLWFAGEARLTAFLAAPVHVNTLLPPHVSLHTETESIPRGSVRRIPAESGLPWTLVVDPYAIPQPNPSSLRLWQAGFAALLLLTGAGIYLIWRAVTRELAVARLQSDFVSAVSHEFRTPLTSLRQLNDLLSSPDEPPSAKRRAYYQAQTRATGRLHHLVESLLDFGRMEAGKQPYRFQPLDAASLTRDVVEEFSAEIEDRGFQIDCRLPHDDCPVHADPDAFAGALWNLLDNAVKYSRENRRIVVGVSRNGHNVRIAVADHGPGIPATDQRRIFEKFVRGDAAKAEGIKGTGIGLAMVRHIMNAHRGAVEVSSTPGEGSTFTLVLPWKEKE